MAHLLLLSGRFSLDFLRLEGGFSRLRVVAVLLGKRRTAVQVRVGSHSRFIRSLLGKRNILNVMAQVVRELWIDCASCGASNHSLPLVTLGRCVSAVCAAEKSIFDA